MFIFWGRKLVYRRVGYVADFCPICRVPRSFEIKRIGSAGHVYYLSVGEGELVGFERTCQECGTSLKADPAVYASVAKQSAPIAALIRSTFPNLAEVLKERLALEERVRQSPMSLSSDERRTLIRTAFILLSPKVEKRFASTHIDTEVGLTIVGALALLLLGPRLISAVAPDEVELSVMLFIALGVALVAWQVLASSGRFMRKEIIPVLARNLRPLRPSEQEIDGVLSELKQLRHKMASKLRRADLLVQVRQ